MATILPPFFISLAALRAHNKKARAFISMVQSQPRSSRSRADRATPEAALLTSISSRPNCDSISSNMLSICSGSPTLALMMWALTPLSRASCAVLSAMLFLRKKFIMTSAPSSASFSVMARPMPREPPVINAILPLSAFSLPMFIPICLFRLFSARHRR